MKMIQGLTYESMTNVEELVVKTLPKACPGKRDPHFCGFGWQGALFVEKNGPLFFHKGTDHSINVYYLEGEDGATIQVAFGGGDVSPSEGEYCCQIGLGRYMEMSSKMLSAPASSALQKVFEDVEFEMTAKSKEVLALRTLAAQKSSEKEADFGFGLGEIQAKIENIVKPLQMYISGGWDNGIISLFGSPDRYVDVVYPLASGVDDMIINKTAQIALADNVVVTFFCYDKSRRYEVPLNKKGLRDLEETLEKKLASFQEADQKKLADLKKVFGGKLTGKLNGRKAIVGGENIDFYAKSIVYGLCFTSF